jgi:hypothetical protein
MCTLSWTKHALDLHDLKLEDKLVGFNLMIISMVASSFLIFIANIHIQHPC